MLYNVSVAGVLVWIEWTPSRARAVAEAAAWRRLAPCLQVRLLTRTD